jgi:hypothetical protein
MHALKKAIFILEDGTEQCIEDPRAALLFQSRINTSGILAGMEDYLVIKKSDKEE